MVHLAEEKAIGQSVCGSFAPCLAALSAISLPGMLTWLGIHWRVRFILFCRWRRLVCMFEMMGLLALWMLLMCVRMDFESVQIRMFGWGARCLLLSISRVLLMASASAK